MMSGFCLCFQIEIRDWTGFMGHPTRELLHTRAFLLIRAPPTRLIPLELYFFAKKSAIINVN